MDATSITPSPHQLRALAHPVRLRMLGLLRVEGPATATVLATRLGLNTGATSYHLRQLATHGFIVDDISQGNGRERWWRAAHSSTRTTNPTPGDIDAEHNTDAYLQTVATIYTESLQRAMEEMPLLPREWRDVSTLSDWHVRITPAKARALLDAIEREIDEVEEEDDQPHFVLQLNAYPRPGQLFEDTELT